MKPQKEGLNTSQFWKDWIIKFSFDLFFWGLGIALALFAYPWRFPLFPD